MANSKRREKYTDRNGNMLIPTNVEGGLYDDHFFTTKKLITVILLLCVLAYLIYLGNEAHWNMLGWIIRIAGWMFLSSFFVRFIIFEEKFYYRMYLDLKEHEVTSPAIFWDIASIKDTEEGAIITYSDAKIAIMVKVDRDTITGKAKDFKEIHYDALSDFYRDIVTQKYSFVQMNIMEQAGKDPRLTELSKVMYKNENTNIQMLMELEIGHIKNITHTSLYESDYFLFYTTDVSKIDTILTDITESMFKLLDGAYVGYRVLNSKEITDLVKEEFGVTYFNSTEASLLMYNNNENSMLKPFNITSILWTDGVEQDLNNNEISRLRNITSNVINETLNISDAAIKKTIYRKERENKIGIDFNLISGNTSKTTNKAQSTNKQQINNTTRQTNNQRQEIRRPTTANIQKQQTVKPRTNQVKPAGTGKVNATNIKKQPNSTGINNFNNDEEFIDI